MLSEAGPLPASVTGNTLPRKGHHGMLHPPTAQEGGGSWDTSRRREVTDSSYSKEPSTERHLFVLSSFDIVVVFLILTGFLTLFSRFNLGANICLVLNLVAVVVVRLPVKSYIRSALVCVVVAVYCTYTAFVAQKFVCLFDHFSAVPFIFILTRFRLVVLVGLALITVILHLCLVYSSITSMKLADADTLIIMLTNIFMLAVFTLTGFALYSTLFAVQQVVHMYKRSPLSALRNIPDVRCIERNAFADLPVGFLLNRGRHTTADEQLFVLLRLSQHSEYRDVIFELMRPTPKDIQQATCSKTSALQTGHRHSYQSEDSSLSAPRAPCVPKFSHPHTARDIRGRENKGDLFTENADVFQDAGTDDLRQFLRASLLQFFLETHPNRSLCSQILSLRPFYSTRQQMDAGLVWYNANRRRRREQGITSPRVYAAGQPIRLWCSSDPRQREDLPLIASQLQVPKAGEIFTLPMGILGPRKSITERLVACLCYRPHCCKARYSEERRQTFRYDNNAVTITGGFYGPFLLPSEIGMQGNWSYDVPFKDIRSFDATDDTSRAVVGKNSMCGSVPSAGWISQQDPQAMKTWWSTTRTRTSLGTIEPHFGTRQQGLKRSKNSLTAETLSPRVHTRPFRRQSIRITSPNRSTEQHVGLPNHNTLTREALQSDPFQSGTTVNAPTQLSGNKSRSTLLLDSSQYQSMETLTPQRRSLKSHSSITTRCTPNEIFETWTSLHWAAYCREEMRLNQPQPQQKHFRLPHLRPYSSSCCKLSDLTVAIFGWFNADFRTISKDCSRFPSRFTHSKRIKRSDNHGSAQTSGTNANKSPGGQRRSLIEAIRSSATALWQFRLNASVRPNQCCPAQSLNGAFRDAKLERWYLVWSTYSEAFIASKLYSAHRLLVFLQIVLYMLSAGLYKWALADITADNNFISLGTLLHLFTCILHLTLLGYTAWYNRFRSPYHHEACHLFKIRNVTLAIVSFVIAETNLYLDTTGTLARPELHPSRVQILVIVSIALKEASAYLTLLTLPLLCICSETVTAYLTVLIVVLKFGIGPLLGIVTNTWPQNIMALEIYVTNNEKSFQQFGFIPEYQWRVATNSNSLASFYFNLFPLFGPSLVFYYVVSRAIQATLRRLFSRTVVLYLMYLDAICPYFYAGEDYEEFEDSITSFGDDEFVSRKRLSVPSKQFWSARRSNARLSHHAPNASHSTIGVNRFNALISVV